ncbi:MAG: hypothetical protein QOG23_3160 [Blastocatellia bacterium]|jgi:hypothetical protein|nr:hypothetical protein [Blastocatellia bacterium]
MRNIRQLTMAVVLTLALNASAFAGIIGTTPEAPPPESSSASATGITGTTPGGELIAPAPDPVMDIALNLLQSLLLAF